MERECGIIERGEIMETVQDGYRIVSFDRDGITTPPLKPLEEGQTYSDGDKVYYFIFKDGTGRIICKL